MRVLDGIAQVMLAGELDVMSAAAADVLLHEAISSGAHSVVVDLALVSFCDAAGLGLLVGVNNILNLQGAQLSLVRVPVALRRLLTITGLADVLHVAPATTADGLLAADLAAAVRLPLVRSVLDAALGLVVTMSQAVMTGADGVSITLPRDDQLRTVAASNDTVLRMDHDQYDTGQGPCLDAAMSGEPFSSKELAQERRWPQFVPRARARGIESIMSTPLLAGGRPLGALNVYSRAADALAAHEQQWATEFAEQASAVLLAADNAVTAGSAAEEIDSALQSREMIALAQGILMARQNLTQEGAFGFLTDISRGSSVPLLHIATNVVNSATPARPSGTDPAHAGQS